MHVYSVPRVSIELKPQVLYSSRFAHLETKNSSFVFATKLKLYQAGWK